MRSPLEAVSGFFTSLQARDLNSAMAFVEKNVIYDNSQLPTLVGADQFRAFLSPYAEHEELEIRIHNGWEIEHWVIIERSDCHRDERDDDWQCTRACGIFEVRDGLITAWRDYFDIASFLKQTGQQFDQIVERVALITGNHDQLSVPRERHVQLRT